MTAIPIWTGKRWRYYPSCEGIRKAFYSSNPSKRFGPAECRRKESEWIESGQKKNRRLRDCWPEYMIDVAARGGTDSVRQRKTHGEQYFIPALGHKIIGSITDQNWQDVINAASIKGVKDKPLSKKTLKNLRGTVSDFYKWAHRSRLMGDKPELYVPRSDSRARKIIQPGDLYRIFEPLENWYIHGWRLMIITGMRPGELYGLKREDVADGFICIRRAVNIHREITGGKNQNARRVIRLPQIGQKEIDDQLELLDSVGMASAWLFPARDARPTRQASARAAWLKFAATAGLSCTPCELRHSFTSIMKDRMSLSMLKTQLGHSSSMDTLGTYAHDVDGELDKAAVIIDEVLNTLFEHTTKVQPCVINMNDARKRLKTGISD